MKTKLRITTFVATTLASMMLLAAGIAQAAPSVSEQAAEQILIHGHDSYPAAQAPARFDAQAAVERLLTGRGSGQFGPETPAYGVPGEESPLTTEYALARTLVHAQPNGRS
jgi:hypothetical protein